jgi:Zn-dependent protease with chaperone function
VKQIKNLNHAMDLINKLSKELHEAVILARKLWAEENISNAETHYAQHPVFSDRINKLKDILDKEVICEKT